MIRSRKGVGVLGTREDILFYTAIGSFVAAIRGFHCDIHVERIVMKFGDKNIFDDKNFQAVMP